MFLRPSQETMYSHTEGTETGRPLARNVDARPSISALPLDVCESACDCI